MTGRTAHEDVDQAIGSFSGVAQLGEHVIGFLVHVPGACVSFEPWRIAMEVQRVCARRNRIELHSPEDLESRGVETEREPAATCEQIEDARFFARLESV